MSGFQTSVLQRLQNTWHFRGAEPFGTSAVRHVARKPWTKYTGTIVAPQYRGTAVINGVKHPYLPAAGFQLSEYRQAEKVALHSLLCEASRFSYVGDQRATILVAGTTGVGKSTAIRETLSTFGAASMVQYWDVGQQQTDWLPGGGIHVLDATVRSESDLPALHQRFTPDVILYFDLKGLTKSQYYEARDRDLPLLGGANDENFRSIDGDYVLSRAGTIARSANVTRGVASPVTEPALQYAVPVRSAGREMVDTSVGAETLRGYFTQYPERQSWVDAFQHVTVRHPEVQRAKRFGSEYADQLVASMDWFAGLGVIGGVGDASDMGQHIRSLGAAKELFAAETLHGLPTLQSQVDAARLVNMLQLHDYYRTEGARLGYGGRSGIDVHALAEVSTLSSAIVYSTIRQESGFPGLVGLRLQTLRETGMRDEQIQAVKLHTVADRDAFGLVLAHLATVRPKAMSDAHARLYDYLAQETII